MKMFLQRVYPQDFIDHNGIEFLVHDERCANRLLAYLKYHLRGTTTVEKYEITETPGPPRFYAQKFVLRAP